jgi:hypothetical protein
VLIIDQFPVGAQGGEKGVYFMSSIADQVMLAQPAGAYSRLQFNLMNPEPGKPP